MFSRRGNREKKKRGRRWGEERDRLNLLHKDMFIIQRKSDISSSSMTNGKYEVSRYAIFLSPVSLFLFQVRRFK